VFPELQVAPVCWLESTDRFPAASNLQHCTYTAAAAASGQRHFTALLPCRVFVMQLCQLLQLSPS
jgi:hypothetical protein